MVNQLSNNLNKPDHRPVSAACSGSCKSSHGVAWWARFLSVSPRTIRRWLNPDTPDKPRLECEYIGPGRVEISHDQMSAFHKACRAYRGSKN